MNELFFNAYKYAFDKRHKGQINVGIKAINEVDDDGVGLPDGFDPKKTSL